MTSTLLTGISELWTLAPALDDPARPGGVGDEQVLQEAALVIEDGLIAWTGPVGQAPPADDIVDLGGRAVLPGWVDSHSHLIFDGDRAAEFEARIAGQAYRAGGLGITTEATRSATDARRHHLPGDQDRIRAHGRRRAAGRRARLGADRAGGAR